MRRMLRSQQNHKFVASPANASGSDGKDGVTGAGILEQKANAVLHGTNVMDVFVASFADSSGQSLAGDAR